MNFNLRALGWTALPQRLRGMFNLNDPRWGRGDDKPSQEGQDAGHSTGPASGQGPSQEPTQQPGPSSNKPGASSGPPDLDELWRDFNDRISGIFGGKKKPGASSGQTGNKPNSTDIPPPSQRGGGNGGGGGMSAPNFNFTNPFGSKASILISAAVVFFIWICSGFFIIQEGQAGVVLTFGKYADTAKPGINWRMPWPIQSDETVNLSGVRSVEVGRPVLIKATNQKDSSMLTEDENIIDYSNEM